MVSPDGRLFWDGQKWVDIPREKRSWSGWALAIVLALALTAGVGLSGWVDLSPLPVSVPVVLEHCAVRYSGSNVIVHFQGIGAEAACQSVGAAWSAYTGPPVGALACHRQRPLGLTWKVYDTGSMVLGADMCGRLDQALEPLAGGWVQPSGQRSPARAP